MASRRLVTVCQTPPRRDFRRPNLRDVIVEYDNQHKEYEDLIKGKISGAEKDKDKKKKEGFAGVWQWIVIFFFFAHIMFIAEWYLLWQHVVR